MTEAVLAVTPSETIKCGSLPQLFLSHNDVRRTKLIDDSKRPNPQYRGLIHGTATIVRQEGLRGIYRGLFPVVRLCFFSGHVAHSRAPPFCFLSPLQMMRQGANSAVRFTTYTTLKQFVQSNARPGQTLPNTITFGIGAIAGLVTVYTTMPLECVLFYFIFLFAGTSRHFFPPSAAQSHT